MSPSSNQLGTNHETTLWHFFSLMKAQSKGQEGSLLVNGCANIFYIKDKHGKLWAVYCRWVSDYLYWDVFAFSVEHPFEWDAGYRVVSRDS